MSETKSDPFDWQLSIVGAIGAVILVLPQMIFGNDALAFFGTIPLAALIMVILIAVAFTKARRHGLAVLGMFCVFLALAWVLFGLPTTCVRVHVGLSILIAKNGSCLHNKHLRTDF